MAENQMEDGSGTVVTEDTLSGVSSSTDAKKIASSPDSSSPCQFPDPKSQEEAEMQTENRDRRGSHVNWRKSWRRSSRTSRTFPSESHPYQVLCRNISTSLSHQERLEKLFEGAIKLAPERTQNSLQCVPNFSLEAFQKQVEHIQTEWDCFAKNMHNEPPHLPSSSVSESDLQNAMGKIQRAINSIQTESKSWEELLNKHQSKAKKLKRKVEKGQKQSVTQSSSTMTQSSQYQVLQSKPNYHNLLCRSQPLLQTIAMAMDLQDEMIRELESLKEQSQLLVKETSSRLAEEAGFKNLSSDVLKNLMSAPSSTVGQGSAGFLFEV